jgi:hypothetical protein
LLDRKEQREGVLHDGTRVVKYFGQWYLSGETEDGKPSKIIDPQHYPEVARDCVPTPEEYYRHFERLPRAERLKQIVGEHRSATMEPVGSALENLWNRIEHGKSD